jgi:hypothetical protein
MAPIRGFKLVFIIIGVVYVLLACSMLLRGPSVLRDFAVAEGVVSAPVLVDFFLFFYQLMAFVGVLSVLFGLVTKDGKSQRLVASVFLLTNILLAVRDLSTSDSRFGNHLYKGDATLVLVYIDLIIATAFGYLTVKGVSAASKRSEHGDEGVV